MKKAPFHLGLRMQLTIVILLIFILLLGSITYFQGVAEEKVFDLMQDQINSLTKAVEISMEQISAKGHTDEARLKNSIEQLKLRGIQELSILSAQQEVILSSNPQRVGSKLSVSKNEFIITEKIGNSKSGEGKKLYSAFVPIISKGKLEGYIHVAMYFDDLEKLIGEISLRRLFWTLTIMGVGLILCILISYWYTKPIPILIDAIREMTQGRMPKLPPILQADIKGLADSLNEMIRKLEEQKTIGEKLKRVEHQAMLAQLASGIAHEIRNPLNFINLSVSHLGSLASEKDAQVRDGSLELVSKIKSEIHRVNQMVTNFLDLGREFVLHPIPLRADLIIEEVLGLNAHILQDRGISVERHFQFPAPVVETDIDKMKSCFQNLVVNAAEPMFGGGILSIWIGAEGDCVKFEFRDTGPGIKQENLPKLFEPYFTTKKTGIGLGLAIARRVVEAHKGSIEIFNAPGRGACARVLLPHTGHGDTHG